MKFGGVSSRVLRQEFPELQKKIRKHLRVPSNYHGPVGKGFEVVESYIKSQDVHHRKEKK
jgi:REP element-mobilizing transposase RayT